MRRIAFLFLAMILCSGVPVRPDYLKEGDKVAVISPSYLPNMGDVRKGMRELIRIGLVPVTGPNLGKYDPGNGASGTSRYGGTVTQRTEDLLWALEDDSIKAIMCARGGYGAIHLLQTVPVEAYAAHPKWIIGYSDITSLHAACLKAGVMSIHANGCAALGNKGAGDMSNRMLLNLLTGVLPEYEWASHSLSNPGHADGILVGGNMITWETLAGSSYDLLTTDSDLILFIEEVEESMHAVDRLFNILLLSGRMDKVKGIVFGEFTDCPKDLPYDSVEHMLSQYAQKLGIPVAYSFPAGHGSENKPLIFGAPVSLDVTADSSHLRFNID